jgi:hypothetical protein
VVSVSTTTIHRWPPVEEALPERAVAEDRERDEERAGLMGDLGGLEHDAIQHRGLRPFSRDL